MTRFVTHLESAIDGTRLDANSIQTMHADRPLWVRYDLDRIGETTSIATFQQRAPDLWRYRELLPIGLDPIEVSMGEGMSPLLPCERLASRFGLKHLWMKDESQLPTGSFKSRGLAMAITMAKSFGIDTVAIPTAGNAGGAAAAYAARAGMRAFVFMPHDTPLANQYECHLAGAMTYRVNGLINDCGRLVREGKEKVGWFDLSTLKEPYRIEGKKTMGLELAEQFEWELPDVILYPTGGGTGLIGMWKAFHELAQLGWLARDAMPKMISVQSDGCCPIVRAFEQGERFAEPFADAHTIASGLRVPVAVGDFMILDAVRESGGCAIAASEERLEPVQRMAIQCEGISICPETAACIDVLPKLIADGVIKSQDRVVIFNTGAAQKYLPEKPLALPQIDLHQGIDWDEFERSK